MRRVVVLLAALLTTVALAQGGAIKVGVLLPFTGQYDWVGANVQPVAQMIADEVNHSGGIGGRDIVLVQGDTEGTVDAGFTAAQKLVNVDEVMALLGPTSLSFSGSKQLIQDVGVPMISPTAGTTELDNAGTKYFFRTVPSDSLGGRAIARAATDAQYLGRSQAFTAPVLMVAKSPAMVSFESPLQTSFQSYGTPLKATLEYAPGKPSYRSEVQEALSHHPDVIVLVGTPEDSVRIMQAAFQAGYQGTWFVTQDQTNADFIKLATPQLANGIYGLEEVASPASAARNDAFKKQFKAYSGKDVKIFGTNTYDAMNVLALAMLRSQLKDGQVTRASVTRNIREVADPGAGKVDVTDYASGKKALEAGQEINYQGLVGPIDFDAYGNITAPFAIRQVKDGAWTDVTILPASALQ